ncbi:hypothetical protein ACLOJK_011409 [Asimina triloba]
MHTAYLSNSPTLLTQISNTSYISISLQHNPSYVYISMAMSLFNSTMYFLVFFLFFITTRTSRASAQGDYYNVVDLGAKADGLTDSTKAFFDAWAKACVSSHPATIYVPPGSYLLSQIVFAGPCNNRHISIEVQGRLVAPSNYAALSSSGRWILFHNVSGVSIYGGTLDGRGPGLWACKASGKACPEGAASLTFNHGEDIKISGLESINSQVSHIVIHGCKNVTMNGVTVRAPGNSPNTNGIHVESSTGVAITRTIIKTGNDCISIGPGTQNLMIDQIACGPGHGISIGSLGKRLDEAGVQNVRVKSVMFSGTTNGVRIKSWARPSNGFVKDVVFEYAIMRNVKNPIVIDQHYCFAKENCPNQLNSGVKISNVTYSNIRGSSTTGIAVKLDCSSSNPCSGIELKDVKLAYINNNLRRRAQSSFENVADLVLDL